MTDFSTLTIEAEYIGDQGFVLIRGGDHGCGIAVAIPAEHLIDVVAEAIALEHERAETT